MGRALLLIVSGMYVVYGVVQLSINSRQEIIITHSSNYASESQSHNIASTMIDLAIREMDHNIESDNAGVFPPMDILGGMGSVTMVTTVDPLDPGHKIKTLTATGIYNGNISLIEVQMERRSFAKYLYFTVVEPNIYFTSGDTIQGPLHSNGIIHISGNPVFNGNVTSPNDWEGSGNPEFNGDANFNSEPIEFPSEVPELVTLATNGGLRFSKSIDVTFHANSTVTIREGMKTQDGYWAGSWYDQYWVSPAYEWNNEINYALSEYNGVISAAEDVLVRGTLNGSATLHAEEDVWFMGDVLYQKNPEIETSDDFLGIVSEGDTYVDSDAHMANGTKDLNLMASIMALGKSFSIENYNDGIERGQLQLYGGLIQYERGPVGTSGGSGYKKKYQFDRRFLSQSPAGFPRTYFYDYIYWKEQ